jgi:DNA invertase Pin-like site-specific DNA recombinase
MEKRRKVIAIVRVSSDGQGNDDKTGIPRQLDGIAAHCKRYNLEIVGKPYHLEGISGANVQHSPKFRQMLERLSDPSIAGCCIATLDRFYRPEFLSADEVFKPFEENGKSLFCDIGELNPRNINDQITISIFARMAGNERQRIKERTTWGRNENRTRPDIKSDPLPVGVEFVRNSPKSKEGKFSYTPDSERVRDAFYRILKGDTLTGTAADLGFSSKQALKTTLRSFWWIGVKASTKTRVDIKVNEDGKYTDGRKAEREKPIFIDTNLAAAPLVPREIFDAVQDILSERRKTWTQRKTKENKFLGAGLIFCKCGKKMYAKGDGREGKSQYYICSSRDTEWCGNPNLNAKNVDTEIWWSIQTYLVDPKFVAHRIKTALSSDEQANASRKRKVLEKVLADLERKKKNVTLAIADGGHDSDLLLLKNSLNEEIAAARQNLRRAASDVAVTVDPEKMASEIVKDFWQFSKRPIAEQKQLLSETVDRIFIDEDGHADFVMKSGLPGPQWSGRYEAFKDRVLSKTVNEIGVGRPIKRGRQKVNPTTNGYPAAKHAFICPAS